MSREFCIVTAEVMAGNNIKAYIYEGIRSTPELSYAVRELGCQGGVVITASHNPAAYNGFKVYGDDGAQLVPERADLVTEEVDKITDFAMVKKMAYQEASEKDLIVLLDEKIDQAYLNDVVNNLQNKSILKEQAEKVKVVYSPLHGTGGRPVVAALKMIGIDSLITVDEQMVPDGEFSTVKLPNPEEITAFEWGIKYADKTGSNVIIATDPDADRTGVAVRTDSGFRVLSGNELGALLTEYVMTTYKLPENPVVVSTIVTSGICKKMCEMNNIEYMETLTGFKFIGEKIKIFEGMPVATRKHYLFGYEESFGYLIGTHVRDKDAVVTTALVLEMYAYYLSKEISLVEQLDNIMKKYGYYKEDLKSISLEGKEGMVKIKAIMAFLRTYDPGEVAGKKMISKVDFENDETGLRKSDVIKFIFNDGSWFAARPSGTEPKLKLYFSICGIDKETVEINLKTLMDKVMGDVSW